MDYAHRVSGCAWSPGATSERERLDLKAPIPTPGRLLSLKLIESNISKCLTRNQFFLRLATLCDAVHTTPSRFSYGTPVSPSHSSTKFGF